MVTVKVICDNCNGSGTVGDGRRDCPVCKGSGYIKIEVHVHSNQCYNGRCSNETI